MDDKFWTPFVAAPECRVRAVTTDRSDMPMVGNMPKETHTALDSWMSFIWKYMNCKALSCNDMDIVRQLHGAQYLTTEWRICLYCNLNEIYRTPSASTA